MSFLNIIFLATKSNENLEIIPFLSLNIIGQAVKMKIDAYSVKY